MLGRPSRFAPASRRRRCAQRGLLGRRGLGESKAAHTDIGVVVEVFPVPGHSMPGVPCGRTTGRGCGGTTAGRSAADSEASALTLTLTISRWQRVAMFREELRPGGMDETQGPPHLQLRRSGAACTTGGDRDAARHGEWAVVTTLTAALTAAAAPLLMRWFSNFGPTPRRRHDPDQPAATPPARCSCRASGVSLRLKSAHNI